jgi:hypothetical protein
MKPMLSTDKGRVFFEEEERGKISPFERGRGSGLSVKVACSRRRGREAPSLRSAPQIAEPF